MKIDRDVLKSYHYLDKILKIIKDKNDAFRSTFEYLYNNLFDSSKFQPSYKTELEEFLFKKTLEYKYEESERTKLHIALAYLKDEKYIIIDSFSNVQLTYNGIHKLTDGFEKRYNHSINKVVKEYNQKRLENFFTVVRIILSIVIFYLGILYGTTKSTSCIEPPKEVPKEESNSNSTISLPTRDSVIVVK